MAEFQVATGGAIYSLKAIHDRVVAARERIRKYVRKTPLELSFALSDMAKETKVYVKLESEQLTGSFKLRGAFSKASMLLESNSKDAIQKGFVTASSGNHGMACAVVSNTFNIPVMVYAPDYLSKAKEKIIRSYGAQIIFEGTDCLEAEVKAKNMSEENGLTYLPPYNDLDVLTGNGTVGLEILEDLPEVDVVLVSVGGGGLIGGIAGYLKHAKPSIKIIGCQPVLSKVMYESVKVGHIVFEESGDTLSDGTAGGIDENSITFDLCQHLVDEWILVPEDAISKAMYFMMEQHHKIIEGAAGVAIGAFMSNLDRFHNVNVAIVSCGSNVSMDKLKIIINEFT